MHQCFIHICSSVAQVSSPASNSDSEATASPLRDSTPPAKQQRLWEPAGRPSMSFSIDTSVRASWPPVGGGLASPPPPLFATLALSPGKGRPQPPLRASRSAGHRSRDPHTPVPVSLRVLSFEAFPPPRSPGKGSPRPGSPTRSALPAQPTVSTAEPAQEQSVPAERSPAGSAEAATAESCYNAECTSGLWSKEDVPDPPDGFCQKLDGKECLAPAMEPVPSDTIKAWQIGNPAEGGALTEQHALVQLNDVGPEEENAQLEATLLGAEELLDERFGAIRIADSSPVCPLGIGLELQTGIIGFSLTKQRLVQAAAEAESSLTAADELLAEVPINHDLNGEQVPDSRAEPSGCAEPDLFSSEAGVWGCRRVADRYITSCSKPQKNKKFSCLLNPLGAGTPELCD